MLSILCSLVFAGLTTMAAATIFASFRRHGAQAIAIWRAARDIPDMRDISVRIVSATPGQMGMRWTRLRRQPRRVAIGRPLNRPATRLTEGPRAAA